MSGCVSSSQQSLQLQQPLRWGVVWAEAGGFLEVPDNWMQWTVLGERRAEIPK